MNPVLRTLGKMVRLVGISSPEDSQPKAKSATDPPSWRDGKKIQGEGKGEASGKEK